MKKGAEMMAYDETEGTERRRWEMGYGSNLQISERTSHRGSEPIHYCSRVQYLA